ncbi:hypothetical protein HYH03_014706 [Edaphochlamys debaryana]|uniref:Myb-like domain-containing protein n=1 Tax=Edaphochlamys debaryana TaxID=47281 RepID=A0A835XTJ5_9CHLO|nr:hypothetical protein HYH03_014706 [Edaphochlamys debaryana]|eukprot:KAG2486650.1 hypothetical protein HYH03_014706 [Edaphochlamys debaryana]
MAQLFFPSAGLGHMAGLDGFEHADARLRAKPWSLGEELRFACAHARIGPRWVDICKLFPGRTPLELKNRWHSTIRAKTGRRSALLFAYVRNLAAMAGPPPPGAPLPAPGTPPVTPDDPELRKAALQMALRQLAAGELLAPAAALPAALEEAFGDGMLDRLEPDSGPGSGSGLGPASASGPGPGSGNLSASLSAFLAAGPGSAGPTVPLGGRAHASTGGMVGGAPARGLAAPAGAFSDSARFSGDGGPAARQLAWAQQERAALLAGRSGPPAFQRRSNGEFRGSAPDLFAAGGPHGHPGAGAGPTHGRQGAIVIDDGSRSTHSNSSGSAGHTSEPLAQASSAASRPQQPHWGRAGDRAGAPDGPSAAAAVAAVAAAAATAVNAAGSPDAPGERRKRRLAYGPGAPNGCDNAPPENGSMYDSILDSGSYDVRYDGAVGGTSGRRESYPGSQGPFSGPFSNRSELGPPSGPQLLARGPPSHRSQSDYPDHQGPGANRPNHLHNAQQRHPAAPGGRPQHAAANPGPGPGPTLAASSGLLSPPAQPPASKSLAPLVLGPAWVGTGNPASTKWRSGLDSGANGTAPDEGGRREWDDEGPGAGPVLAKAPRLASFTRSPAAALAGKLAWEEGRGAAALREDGPESDGPHSAPVGSSGAAALAGGAGVAANGRWPEGRLDLALGGADGPQSVPDGSSGPARFGPGRDGRVPPPPAMELNTGPRRGPLQAPAPPSNEGPAPFGIARAQEELRGYGYGQGYGHVRGFEPGYGQAYGQVYDQSFGYDQAYDGEPMDEQHDDPMADDRAALEELARQLEQERAVHLEKLAELQRQRMAAAAAAQAAGRPVLGGTGTGHRPDALHAIAAGGRPGNTAAAPRQAAAQQVAAQHAQQQQQARRQGSHELPHGVSYDSGAIGAKIHMQLNVGAQGRRGSGYSDATDGSGDGPNGSIHAASSPLPRSPSRFAAAQPAAAGRLQLQARESARTGPGPALDRTSAPGRIRDGDDGGRQQDTEALLAAAEALRRLGTAPPPQQQPSRQQAHPQQQQQPQRLLQRPSLPAGQQPPHPQQQQQRPPSHPTAGVPRFQRDSIDADTPGRGRGLEDPLLQERLSHLALGAPEVPLQRNLPAEAFMLNGKPWKVKR